MSGCPTKGLFKAKNEILPLRTAWQFYLYANDVNLYRFQSYVIDLTDLHALNFKNCSKIVNWILVELENIIFWFLVIGLFKHFFCFISMKISLSFIWGTIMYFCTMNGFFRMLKKTSSELICERLPFILVQDINLAFFQIFGAFFF